MDAVGTTQNWNVVDFLLSNEQLTEYLRRIAQHIIVK